MSMNLSMKPKHTQYKGGKLGPPIMHLPNIQGQGLQRYDNSQQRM